MGEKINVKDIVKRKKEDLKKKVEFLKEKNIIPKLVATIFIITGIIVIIGTIYMI